MISDQFRIVNRAPLGREADRRVGSILTRQARARQTWYAIRDATRTGGAAEVYIYAEIGYWGITAAEFIDEFNSIDADEITLHVNSPGGEVYDGIAIYRAILAHPARVLAVVDALAASAASFIVQAADEVEMGRQAEMMIHDAIGIVVGNAENMRELAKDLDRVSDSIAAIYAERAGGEPESWRDVMRAEQWYTAEEAVAAGLADRVAPAPGRRSAATPEDRALVQPVMAGEAVSAFRYKSRREQGSPPATVQDAADRPVGNRSEAAPPLPVELVEIPATGTGWEPVRAVDALHLGIAEPRFALTSVDLSTILAAEIGDRPAPPADLAPALTRTTTTAPVVVDLNAALREGLST